MSEEEKEKVRPVLRYATRKELEEFLFGFWKSQPETIDRLVKLYKEQQNAAGALLMKCAKRMDRSNERSQDLEDL